MARWSGSFRSKCRLSSSPPASSPRNPAPPPTASAAASQRLAAVPLYIDDPPAISVAALRTRARRLKRQQGLGLIVVDYLQLLRPRYRIGGWKIAVRKCSKSPVGL